MSNITILASIKIKEEFTKEIYSLLVNVQKSTKENDEGYIQYDLHKDLDDENSFTFIETWENEEFLDKHMKKEHFNLFIKSVDNKLEYLKISKLKKI